jgi:hypothetical protein
MLAIVDAYSNDRPYDKYWKNIQDDRRLLACNAAGCLAIILSELPFEIDGGAAVITAASKIAQLPRGFTFGDLDGFCGLKPALAEASGLKELWTGQGGGRRRGGRRPRRSEVMCRRRRSEVYLRRRTAGLAGPPVKRSG